RPGGAGLGGRTAGGPSTAGRLLPSVTSPGIRCPSTSPLFAKFSTSPGDRAGNVTDPSEDSKHPQRGGDMNDAKLDLITKLLAKAESTTPEEAEALTEHAERLMLKYGIEQARIDEQRARRGEAQEEIVKERMLFTGAYARDLREIGIRVAAALETVTPLQADQ